MKNIITPILFAVLLAGCATQSTAPRQALTHAEHLRRTSRTYDAPKSAVWPLVVSEVDRMGPVRAVEKDSGLLTTDFVSMQAGYNYSEIGGLVIPPGSFLAIWAGLRMKLSVLVTEPETGKTQVTIRTHYEAFDRNVSKSWIVCQSTGALELVILTRISQQLTGRPF